MSNADNAYRFAAQLKTWAGEKYPALALYISQDFAWQAIEDVVLGTPVVTGYTRNQNQVSFFGAAVSEIPGVDPSGFNTIVRERARILNVKPFQNIHISQPVAWGPMLEARYGMFAQAMAKAAANAKVLGARGWSRWKAANP